MKELSKVKKGDKIRLTQSDEIVKYYITKNLFNGIDIYNLRAVCNLKEFVYYKVYDNCISCKILKIISGKHVMYIPYRFIDTTK